MIRRGLGRFHRRLLQPVLGSAFAGPFLVTLGLTGSGCVGPAVPPPLSHRLVLHVNGDDPAAMRQAISSSLNATRHYGDRR